MPEFRKTNRDFTEGLFRNARRQESSGSLGAESLKEFLIDPKSGEVFPIKYENVSLQIDQHGFPVSVKERGIRILDCSHKPCGLSQVLGRCQFGHVICDKCTLYTCALCGKKLCDLDVLRLEDESTVCPEHEKEIMNAKMKTGLLTAVGHTVLYLCGWSGTEYDD